MSPGVLTYLSDVLGAFNGSWPSVTPGFNNERGVTEAFQHPGTLLRDAMIRVRDLVGSGGDPARAALRTLDGARSEAGRDRLIKQLTADPRAIQHLCADAIRHGRIEAVRPVLLAIERTSPAGMTPAVQRARLGLAQMAFAEGAAAGGGPAAQRSIEQAVGFVRASYLGGDPQPWLSVLGEVAPNEVDAIANELAAERGGVDGLLALAERDRGDSGLVEAHVLAAARANHAEGQLALGFLKLSKGDRTGLVNLRLSAMSGCQRAVLPLLVATADWLDDPDLCALIHATFREFTGSGQPDAQALPRLPPLPREVGRVWWGSSYRDGRLADFDGIRPDFGGGSMLSPTGVREYLRNRLEPRLHAEYGPVSPISSLLPGPGRTVRAIISRAGQRIHTPYDLALACQRVVVETVRHHRPDLTLKLVVWLHQDAARLARTAVAYPAVGSAAGVLLDMYAVLAQQSEFAYHRLENTQRRAILRAEGRSHWMPDLDPDVPISAGDARLLRTMAENGKIDVAPAAIDRYLELTGGADAHSPARVIAGFKPFLEFAARGIVPEVLVSHAIRAGTTGSAGPRTPIGHHGPDTRHPTPKPVASLI